MPIIVLLELSLITQHLKRAKTAELVDSLVYVDGSVAIDVDKLGWAVALVFGFLSLSWMHLESADADFNY